MSCASAIGAAGFQGCNNLSLQVAVRVHPVQSQCVLLRTLVLVLFRFS